jgi:Tol biopolymer transport system component
VAGVPCYSGIAQGLLLLLCCSCTFDPNTQGSAEEVLPPCETIGVVSPGISMTPVVGALIEGGESIPYELVLDSEPCASLRLDLSGGSDVDIVPSSLTFTIENWDQAQNVALIAVHDFEEEGPHLQAILHEIVTSDQDYSGLPDPAFDVDILDRAHVLHASVSQDALGANGDSFTPVVSDDGRYLAFASDASNLVPSDSGASQDVFLRDLVEGVTTRLSEGTSEGDGDSEQPRISSDGQVVAYFSSARNLTADNTSTSGEAFRYDLGSGLTTLVSGQCGGCNNEISNSGLSLSGDGTTVAYSTRRRLLADPEDEYDIFLADSAPSQRQASLNSSGENGTFYWGSNAFGPMLSATGRFVGFHSAAQNLSAPEITVQNFHSYVKDMDQGDLVRVSAHHGGSEPCNGSHQSSSSTPARSSLSGTLAAFSSDCVFELAQGDDSNNSQDVLLRDIATMSTSRVSVASDGTESNGASSLVGISDDGTLISFVSEASNLVADDTNDALDLFVHDTVSATTRRISYDLFYNELPSGVRDASMSRNGQYLVFTTRDDLLPSDINATVADVYRVQVR